MLGASVFEAVIVLLIMHVPIVLRLLYEGMDSAQMTWTAAWSMFMSSYRYGDILGYTSGLLASSTAWFLLNLHYSKHRPKTILALIVLPLLLFFFASPMYFRDLKGPVENHEFAEAYVKFLLGSAAALWIVSMYQQRSIPSLRLSDGDQIKDIMKNVTDGHGARK